MMNSKKKRSKSNQQAELSADVVFEILLRLPIKKVFQLSCVSKLWRSLILRPDFLPIYRSRNSNALVITVSLKIKFSQINRVYHSILEQQHESIDDTPPLEFVDSLSKMNTDDAVRITQPVNGLVCVCYNDSNNRRSLSLMSVRTGEIVMRLPDPGKHPLARYFLGFEPVNGVYKLLKIVKPIEYFCSKITDSNSYDFEILTISRKISDNMCWIKLPKSSAPVVFGNRGKWPCNPYLDTQSYSVNRFLFWLCHETLISFDLREYKFRSIQPPLNINKLNLFQYSQLTQFRGQLAFLKREIGDLLPMIYTFDDKNTCWTRHGIPLPCEVQRRLQAGCRVIPVGNLPTGEILLALVGTDDPITSIYSYDYRNSGSFQKFVVGKFPDCANSGEWDYAPHIRFDVDDGFCCI